MPAYDYQCRACGTVYEVRHSMLEDGPTTCERCGGQLRRVINPSGIIFKGSGFYRNDSRSSSSTSTASSNRTSSGTGSDGAASDSSTSGKSDAAAAPKSEPTPKAPTSSGSGGSD